MPKQAYFGDHQVKTFKLHSFLPETSQTKELTMLMELEKIGINQMKNSSNHNGSKTSKHKQDALSFAQSGFLLFLFSYSSLYLFPVPLGPADPPPISPSPHTNNWYLTACFFLLFISLAMFGSA